MKHLIKSYTEFTTIYVLGCDFENRKPTVSLTDDYMNCDCVHTSKVDPKNFNIPGGNKSLETGGYLYILTQEELDEEIDDIIRECSSQEGFKIENFIGDIYVDVLDEEDNSILKENANLKDYLMYETEDETECEEIRIIFPEGSLSNAGDVEEIKDLLGFENCN